MVRPTKARWHRPCCSVPAFAWDLGQRDIGGARAAPCPAPNRESSHVPKRFKAATRSPLLVALRFGDRFQPRGIRDADPGGRQTRARTAQGNQLGQRQGVLRSRNGDLVPREQRGVALHQAGPTEPECLRLIVQRTAARRAPERAPVNEPGARAHGRRGLAPELQRVATDEGSGRRAAGLLRGSPEFAREYS